MHQAFRPRGINRVVLCTDGDFNVGLTGSALIELIEEERERDITLTVLGFGRGNINDRDMEGLADHGNGNYAFIDSNDQVDAAEIGAGIFTTAYLEIELKGGLDARRSRHHGAVQNKPWYMSLNHSMTTPFPVDDVADLLCSERYCADSQGKREDVVSFRFVDQGETDSERRFEVHLQTWGRSKTGKPDRSKTEDSVLRYRFDKRARALHWSRHGKQGDKVVIKGITRLTDDGGGTRIDREATVVVRIPIVGRAVEKIILREFRKGWARSGDQIARLLSDAKCGPHSASE